MANYQFQPTVPNGTCQLTEHLFNDDDYDDDFTDKVSINVTKRQFGQKIMLISNPKH